MFWLYLNTELVNLWIGSQKVSYTLAYHKKATHQVGNEVQACIVISVLSHSVGTAYTKFNTGAVEVQAVRATLAFQSVPLQVVTLSSYRVSLQSI